MASGRPATTMDALTVGPATPRMAGIDVQGWAFLRALECWCWLPFRPGWSAYFALVSFTGCFIECGEPDTGTGVLWGSLALFFLGLPVLTGLVVARVPLRRGLPWLIGLGGAVTLGAVLAQRVI